jgi:RNA polymerase sigma-70 factor (ECF subfamily)
MIRRSFPPFSTAIGRNVHLTCKSRTPRSSEPGEHVEPRGSAERRNAERRNELDTIFADERTFREWYDLAARRVYAYLFGRCGGEASLAEELTQLTFIDAIRHRGTYDGRADAITWLIAIGRNRLLDHLRRQEREERRRLRVVVREIAIEDRHDAAWHEMEDRDQIVQALRRLPASQRAALILHHVDGLSVRDVAIAMRRTQTAVESLLSRGRERFRMVYEERDRG